ncbi:hypothetical protein [Pseudoalteromonas luteoviolacea]|uniref:Lipoprotein n=1 Tax=Pseudoalteromonas luteoviolacea S4060-1 TaxID=1365257 RepID=A0A162C2V8_9GAMM|nr:hypothetical protein [Pseudoalteromonas luteoviolacea]KZN61324.1 hypothetical protein N478_04465 [Pseudoalteromonas luteoviolacea S4060-1]
MKSNSKHLSLAIGLLASSALFGCSNDSEHPLSAPPPTQQEGAEQPDYSKNDKFAFSRVKVIGNDNSQAIPAIEGGEVFDIELTTQLFEEFPTGMVIDVYVYPVDELEDQDNIEKFLSTEKATLLEGYVAKTTQVGEHNFKIESVYLPGNLPEGNYNLIVKLAETEEDIRKAQKAQINDDKSFQPVMSLTPVYIFPRKHVDIAIQNIYTDSDDFAQITANEIISTDHYTQDPVVVFEAEMINTGDTTHDAQVEAFWIYEGIEYPMGVLGQVFDDKETGEGNESQSILTNPTFKIDKTTKYVQSVGVALFADKTLHSKMLAQATDLTKASDETLHTFKLKWHSKIDGDETNNEMSVKLPLLAFHSHDFDAKEEELQKRKKSRLLDFINKMPELHNGNLLSKEIKFEKQWGNEDKFALKLGTETNYGIQILPLPGTYFNFETAIDGHMFKAKNTIFKVEAKGRVYMPIKVKAKNKESANEGNDISPKDEMAIEATLLGLKVFEKTWDQEEGLSKTKFIDDIKEDELKDIEENKKGKLEKSLVGFSYELKKDTALFKKTFYPKGIPVEIEGGYQFHTNPNITAAPYGVGVKIEGKLPTRAGMYAKGGVSIYVARAGAQFEGVAVEIPESYSVNDEEKTVGVEATAGLSFVWKDIPNTNNKGMFFAYSLNAESNFAIKALSAKFGLFAERRKCKRWCWGTYWHRYPTWWLWQSNWLYQNQWQLFSIGKSEVPIWKIYEIPK